MRSLLAQAALISALLLSLAARSYALAHSGGLDSNGCHAGSKPYHCHRASSEMMGNRLKCELGSRSSECIGLGSSQYQSTPKATIQSSIKDSSAIYKYTSNEEPSPLLVKKVQVRLKVKRLYIGDINGIFDARTALAIDIYKIKNNIESDSYFGKGILHNLGITNEDN